MTVLAPYGLSALTVEPPSLESLFLGLYDGDARSGPGGSAATP